MAAGQDNGYPWYSVVKGPDIQQGDILQRCPILAPVSVDDLDKDNIGTVGVYRQRSIVMSQSCDLIVRKGGKAKIKQAILCPFFDKAQIESTLAFDNEKWEDARRGRMPRYHVLNKCDLREVKADFGLIDLGEIISLPVDVVRELAKREGDRLRLNPPYREHMAQAFARFFMRVGLPVDIPSFSK
jgi:hypothetical protein